MKNKVVIWGTNAQEQKVLIALELQAEANKVMLYTFPETIATDDFVNKMMNEWRNGQDVEFPEGHVALERELNVTDSLLPDDLKVERGDIIQRAQTEWHFAVLSSKLHAAYQQELEEFKEKIQQLSSYDSKVWDGLKAFWDKVQTQSRERNLFREHADKLRDNINVLFDELKKLREKVQSEFSSASQKLHDEFAESLEEIEKRIAAGGSKMHTVFDDLKKMQSRYREARLNNEHRNAIWERLDKAFKSAKERKFGPSANEGSLTERHQRRLQGLDEAIKRMEHSVKHDEDELNFQRKKVDSSEGQLEMQIRTAKIKMIEERVASKREKLNEMLRTRAEVERQLGSASEREQKRSEKEADRKKFDAAKEQAKADIAAGIKTRDGADGLKDDNLFEATGTLLGELLEEAIDTAKAVATVVADKADKAIDAATEKAKEVRERISNDDKPEGEKSMFDKIVDVVEDAVDVVKDAVGNIASEAKDQAETAAEKAEDIADKIEDKAEAIADKVEDKAEAIADKVEDKVESVVESGVIGETIASVKDAAENIVDTAKDQASDAVDQLKSDDEEKTA